jgi:hypothetical protein
MELHALHGPLSATICVHLWQKNKKHADRFDNDNDGELRILICEIRRNGRTINDGDLD